VGGVAEPAGGAADAAGDGFFRHGGRAGGIVMLLMVVLGVSLRFIPETKADNVAAKLKAMISVTATVVRNGQAREIPLREGCD
jgi:Mg2+-importing ATPase